jgi:hypothetical protein
VSSASLQCLSPERDHWFESGTFADDTSVTDEHPDSVAAEGTQHRRTQRPHEFTDHGLCGDTVDRVRAAAAYTVAVKTDGTLWAWGANESGQLGDGTDTDETAPVQVGVGHQWFKLSVGSYQHHGAACPLASGETGVRRRVSVGREARWC